MRLVRPLVVLGALSASSPALAQTAPVAQPDRAPAATEGAPPAAPAEAVAAAEPVVAPPKNEGDNPYFPVTTRRRYGFTLGLEGGANVTRAEGSGMQFTARTTPTSTGAAFGTGQSLWIGGVFTDWFSFHLGMTFNRASVGDHEISGTGFMFGLETWPLFARGGVFRDLGLGLDFGTGTAEVRSKARDKVEADGGGMSMVRASVFWDAVSAWKLNLGPFVAYERRTGEVYSQDLAWLGVRAVFYGVNRR
ncbi:MAG: hypothetical protein IT374_13070 [Polyangiaceae bacterium]|nr:hypothetical protein [Polyangiaceae bacterium]